MANRKAARKSSTREKRPSSRSVKRKRAASASSPKTSANTRKTSPASDAIDAEAEAILQWFFAAWQVVSYAHGDEPRDNEGKPIKLTELLDRLHETGVEYGNLQLTNTWNNDTKSILTNWTIVTGPDGYRSKCAGFAADVSLTVNPFGAKSVFLQVLAGPLRQQLIARWPGTKKKLASIPILNIDSLLKAYAHERLLAKQFAQASTIAARKTVESSYKKLPPWNTFITTVPKSQKQRGAKAPLTQLQNAIMSALDGNAYTGEALAHKLHTDKRELYRGRGIKELMAAGRVQNDGRIGGYYRPDSPPLNTTTRRNSAPNTPPKCP